MRLILGMSAVLFGWMLAHGAGAATIPQEVQGRWSPEGTCAADEPVITCTETTFQLAEYGGVRRVEVDASGDPRTALRLRVVRGTTSALRHVAGRRSAVVRGAAFAVRFGAADWPRVAGVGTIRAAWAGLRFDVRPIYELT